MLVRLHILWIVALFAAAPIPVSAEKRVALVIGNAAYSEAPLKNPLNDARAMAARLQALGFRVLLRENTTKLQMERAVADFGDLLDKDTVGLFFFAGHGMQVDGRNFLLPTDARIATQQRVRLETLDVDVVLDQMAAAGSRVNLVVLDACRNNPFERRFRATGGGLAQINAPQGTLIAYATAPGKIASDGAGENGLYTQELLRALEAPGLQVEEVFKQVRGEVIRRSAGGQTPWEASSLVGSFTFLPGNAPVVAAAPQTVTAAPAPADRGEREDDRLFWESIRNSNDPSEFRAYLDRFENGTFAALARSRLAQLQAKPAPPTATVAAVAPKPSPSSRPAPAPAAFDLRGVLDRFIRESRRDQTFVNLVMRGQAMHLSTDTLTEATNILEPKVVAETAETVTVRATVLLENRNQNFKVPGVEFIVSKAANSVVEYRYK